MDTNYFNTTNIKDKSLSTAKDKALSQDQLVLSTFKEYNAPLSPSDILKLSFSDRTPLTSIRRSISTLTKRGRLVKTTTTVKGKYGKPEHLWCAA